MNTHNHSYGPVAHETAGGFTGWVNDLTSGLGRLSDADPVSVALLAACAVMTAVLVTLVVRTARPSRTQTTARSRDRRDRRGWSGERGLIGVAIAVAVGVAGIGGVRSFEAVSDRFNSALVPLTADGMIVACTALRLAALSRGWRLPGSLVITYAFITGTVWLNVASAHGWADAVAHALAPLAYAALVEMLAHMLRLHLRLVEPPERRRSGVAGLARLGWLTWVTSPVVTTRVGLHLARTGSGDPVAARALVQQLIRMSSRLQAVCPSPPGLAWWPFGSARAARSAALQTIRDGLLSARDLAGLLPAGHGERGDADRLTPGGLLALVDSAALQCTAPASTTRTAVHTADRTGAPEPVHHNDRTSAAAADRTSAPDTSRTAEPRTDDDLVAALHRHAAEHNDGQPMSQREVMRVLGVGTPKAKRLAVRAGWAEPTVPAPQATNEVPDQIPGQLALVHETDEARRTHEYDTEELDARNSQ